MVRQKIKQKLQKLRLRKHVMSLFLACSLFLRTYDDNNNAQQPIIAATTAPTTSTTKLIASTADFYNDRRANKLEKFAVESTYIPRGGGNNKAAAMKPKEEVKSALSDLSRYMGPKKDILVLLAATALIPSICVNVLNISPILGFLAAGTLLGPNLFNVIQDTHMVELLGELGIVFFLFEMGVELSTERLIQMKKDVFGLGLSQFTGTTLLATIIGTSLLKVPLATMMIVSGGLALSSSAFVLQLLKDKQELGTRHGKAAFGVLLFQDLAVVPLLVITPLLAPNSAGMTVIAAVRSAILKAAMALSGIFFAGRVIMQPLFRFVSKAKSQEAFLGVCLLTVLSLSFLTEGLGLSNTLGAFLAGSLLSETKYRYQIEADISSLRGVLLGLFFVTVGFEIDLLLVWTKLGSVLGLLSAILGLKSLITLSLAKLFGLSLPNAIQTSLLLSQGGEFAFVTFGMARNLGILTPDATRLLLTSVALSMAVTPFLAQIASQIAKQLEEKADFGHYLGQDREVTEIVSGDSGSFVVVVGYGTIGKMVCDLLDRKFIKYVGLEVDPNKAIQARNRGLPVFYGDISRPEVASAFGVHKSQCSGVILTISEPIATNHAVISLRRTNPDLKIFARAKDELHKNRLQNTLNVSAMIPSTFEDNLMLSLPFGGAVLESLGADKEVVATILENKRRELVAQKYGSDGDDVEEEEEEEEEEENIVEEYEVDTVAFNGDDDILDGNSNEEQEDAVMDVSPA